MLSEYCKQCLLKRQQERVRDLDHERKESYLKEAEACIASATQEDTAPVISYKINLLHEQYFGIKYSFEQEKKKYNQVMLQKEQEISSKIDQAQDPLKQAILYARAGNYIDFGALGSVDDEVLGELLHKAEEESLDQRVYEEFLTSCKSAESIVYLTDNCGEIVMDKLLIRQLKKQFPNCSVTVIVRGEDVLNDATVADAMEVGMNEVATVIGNGTGIAGTSLLHITAEARTRIEKADCIIAKGQGNFETLNHCGLNVFYLFLCKCHWFVTRFDLPQFQGVFVRDCDLK